MQRYLPIVLLTFLPVILSAQQLYRMPPPDAQSKVSSFENINGVKGQGGKTNQGAKGNAYESLKAGEQKVLLDVSGAGIIQRMWFTVPDRSFSMLRSLRLQMFWDGADKPAVDVPLGDFFGSGLGRSVPFESALFTSPEGRSFNCYVPMPYKKGAKVIILNEGKVDLQLLFFDIDFVELPKADDNSLYFHACWRRQQTSALGADFELLPKVRGRGRFLGVNVGVNADTAYAATWWGEGEVKMYMDGDSTYPTINGTGTEDYIGTGWGLGPYAHQYQGCPIADEKTKQYAFYRYHIPDQIYFQTDFRAAIQQIGGGDKPVVRELLKKGVRLKPVSVSNEQG
ncbi:MAG TPA: DUF2961 domain-containing protein, partial [Saprospiraceae bacterium]|nr:DUF2961 domain-containing protein [Saprospiraceae bacterium]